MAQYINEPSRTFNEFLLIPGYSSKECRVTSSEYDTLARHRHMLFGKTDSIKILDALNKQGYKKSGFQKGAVK